MNKNKEYLIEVNTTRKFMILCKWILADTRKGCFQGNSEYGIKKMGELYFHKQHKNFFNDLVLRLTIKRKLNGKCYLPIITLVERVNKLSLT